MPIMRCTKDGKCYTGQGARARAARQGRAIEASKSRQQKQRNK